MDYLIISDIPTPWREPVFERVYRRLDGKAQIIYFKNNEKRRLWNFRLGSHPKTILRAFSLTIRGTERFFNPGIVPLLIQKRPRMVLLFASIKDPSGLLAMLMCRILRIKVALLDDSWIGRDKGINGVQRFVRRVVYKWFGDAYVGTSKKTLEMFKHYNPRLDDEQCFLSHLVADNEYFQTWIGNKIIERHFDAIFSGRIVNVKNPIFFAEVCAEIKAQLGKCNVLIIGEGEEILKESMRSVFEKSGVTYQFAGFIPHETLPNYYAQAKILLLPTSGDCWGVVINEAMVSGTPVITTEWTAAAGELVIHGENGYVLPLDVSKWALAAVNLLSNLPQWSIFSMNAKNKVKEFNYDNAAEGILSAFSYLHK